MYYIIIYQYSLLLLKHVSSHCFVHGQKCFEMGFFFIRQAKFPWAYIKTELSKNETQLCLITYE